MPKSKSRNLPGWAKPKRLPPQGWLHDRFAYDPTTGKLTSKSEVGTVNRLGYRTLTFKRSRFLVHRLVWKLVYGKDPTMVDHINGNPSDNRICNLREVTQHQNQMNLPDRKGRKLPRGVIHVKVGKPFRAAITIKGRHYHLGSFNSPEEASAVYETRAAKAFGKYRRQKP